MSCYKSRTMFVFSILVVSEHDIAKSVKMHNRNFLEEVMLAHPLLLLYFYLSLLWTWRVAQMWVFRKTQSDSKGKVNEKCIYVDVLKNPWKSLMRWLGLRIYSLHLRTRAALNHLSERYFSVKMTSEKDLGKNLAGCFTSFLLNQTSMHVDHKAAPKISENLLILCTGWSQETIVYASKHFQDWIRYFSVKMSGGKYLGKNLVRYFTPYL